MPEDLAASLKKAVQAQAKVISAQQPIGHEPEVAAEEVSDVRELRRPAG